MSDTPVFLSQADDGADNMVWWAILCNDGYRCAVKSDSEPSDNLDIEMCDDEDCEYPEILETGEFTVIPCGISDAEQEAWVEHGTMTDSMRRALSKKRMVGFIKENRPAIGETLRSAIIEALWETGIVDAAVNAIQQDKTDDTETEWLSQLTGELVSFSADVVLQVGLHRIKLDEINDQLEHMDKTNQSAAGTLGGQP